MRQIIQPSWSNGFARSAGESAYPELWRGLVGAWVPALGPTGGMLMDVSGNGNHGTLTNMDPATDWITKEGGFGLDFDGSNDYISILHKSIFNLPLPFSITISLRFISLNNLVVFEKNQNSGFSVQINQGQIATNTGGTNTAQNSCWSNKIINDGFWHIATINFVGVGRSSIYIDGQETSLKYANSGTPLYGDYSMVYIGGRTNQYSFPGSISCIYIHNNPMTQSQIGITHRDILSPFRLRKRTLVTVPLSFKPFWASQSNQIIGAA